MTKEDFTVIKKAPKAKEYHTDISKWKEEHKNQYAIIEVNPADSRFGRILMRSSRPLHIENFDLDEYDAEEKDCIEIYAQNPKLGEGRTLTSEEVKKTIQIIK